MRFKFKGWLEQKAPVTEPVCPGSSQLCFLFAFQFLEATNQSRASRSSKNINSAHTIVLLNLWDNDRLWVWFHRDLVDKQASLTAGGQALALALAEECYYSFFMKKLTAVWRKHTGSLTFCYWSRGHWEVLVQSDSWIGSFRPDYRRPKLDLNIVEQHWDVKLLLTTLASGRSSQQQWSHWVWISLKILLRWWYCAVRPYIAL